MSAVPSKTEHRIQFGADAKKGSFQKYAYMEYFFFCHLYELRSMFGDYFIAVSVQGKIFAKYLAEYKQKPKQVSAFSQTHQ